MTARTRRDRLTSVPGATAEQALDVLAERFGFDSFRPGQEQVVAALLAGRSALAVFPTGAGKSLCYQLPALLLDGVTVVVSPLIALMKDQIDFLSRRGVAAARLDSSLGPEETRVVAERLRDGALRLLYVAPERFNNERFLAQLGGAKIALFAVDEAHCISEWGHSFRPDYLKLARFARQCEAERMLALTATATPQVLDDICREFAKFVSRIGRPRRLRRTQDDLGIVALSIHPKLFCRVRTSSSGGACGMVCRDGLCFHVPEARERGAA